jgi:TrpR-related protein YerC/YecD
MKQNKETELDVYSALLLLETREEMYHFLNDLCTTQEVQLLAERWRIYKILEEGSTYREMREQTGISAATMERVVRLLKDEPRCGYMDSLGDLRLNQEEHVRI